MLLNEYQPGQGIDAHRDGPLYAPRVAILSLCSHCAFEFLRNDAARQPVSDMQRQVGASLRRLGETAVVEEHITADGHSLDYALVDERIAIEVDGPSHFVAHGDGAGRAELGKTVLKRRQLGVLGWRLVAVPFFEWEERNSPDKEHEAANRDAYIKAKLADARGAPAAASAEAAPALAALSYPQLQAECKRLGLPAVAKAEVLRERIAAHRAGGG